MSKTRRTITAVAVTIAAALGTLGIASPAQAATAYGCGWPRVCFYLTSTNWDNQDYTAAFQDITSSYQTLGSSSRGSWAIYNSRNDDGALLHFANGNTYCLQPNYVLFDSAGWSVDKIRIMSSATC